MEHDKILIEIRGNNARQHCQHRKKQSGSDADHLRQHASDICFQKQKQDHTGHDQSKADPAQGKSAQKQSTHVFHMSYFPVIEEFSRLSIHNCRYMKVFPAAPQICHHLVGHIKQVIHFHMNII